MLVAKREAVITMWCGGKAGLLLIKFAIIALLLPFVFYGGCYVFSGFDLDEAWFYFAKDKDRYGITYYFLSLILYGVFVLGVISTAILMIIATSRDRKLRRLDENQANQTIEVYPYGENHSDMVTITIKGRSGSRRLARPYVEVFIEGMYLAGLMGNEGIIIHVPNGDYKISLETASYLDQDEANQIVSELDGPLTSPINKKMDRQFNYTVSFLVQIKEQKDQLYYFKTSSVVKRLSQDKRKYGMFDYITAWKN